MLDFKEKEKEILDFWEENDIFQKSVDKSSPQGDYLFYDGPPFATGTPHYGHLVASIMKDVVPRYFTMQGYKVERRWGWDCHGLPIENIVEKELGYETKKQIEEMGVKEFNDRCRARVLDYADSWKKTVRRIGRWVDMENPYMTMDPEFMESVWWVFKQLWDKGLIYEDYRSMHICPRCETTLSQSEVTEGYKDIKDLSLTAKFELVDEPGTYVLAWTTTPWTLIGNVALAIGKDIDYIKVEIPKGFDPKKYDLGDFDVKPGKYIFSKEAAKKDKGNLHKLLFLSLGGHVNTAKVKSKDLLGKEYRPLFDYFLDIVESDRRPLSLLDTDLHLVDFGDDQKIVAILNDSEERNKATIKYFKDNAYKIYTADFVTTEEGTGVVHVAPAFGEDDMNFGRTYKVPGVQHVAMDGSINKEAKDFAGLNVKPKDDVQATDVEILKYLVNKGLYFGKEKYEHSYPHCWRCDTPLLNYATSSWFVNVTKIKTNLLKDAKKINWIPEHIKAGRFGKWLEGARDWSISRQRFWASVMPIWECQCGEKLVFGSIAELEEASGQKVDDLHKHVVDEIKFPCVKCSKEMTRVPDVLDTWFDSGSMPYAQFHYPFENEKEFDKKFPAKFIAEGADQTRAWFYYLHVIAGGIKDSHAYDNCIVNGIVLAEDGKKMSKKLNNYPEPDLVMEKYGADALRMYLLSSPVMLAENFSFTEKDLQTIYRRYIVILQNVLNFYLMFAGDKKLDGDKPKKLDNDLDKWIVSRLVKLQHEVSSEIEKYNLVKPTRAIFDFVDGLSTWYVRRSRDRFKEGDKQAIETLAFVLKELSKIIAPFSPMTSEAIYKEFKTKKESVHLEEWNNLDSKLIDNKVLEQMDASKQIAEKVHALRAKAGVKVRQPLSAVQVLGVSDLASGYIEILEDELNVESVEPVKTLDKNDGWILDEEETISLDTNLTDDLKDKGVVREIIRFINAMRKDAGLKPSDNPVETYNTKSDYLKSVIVEYKEELVNGTSAGDLIEVTEDPKTVKQVKVNGEEITLGLKI